LRDPFFSVVIPDYHRSVSAYRREQCIESLLRSSWRDYEILLYHDGPAPEELVAAYGAYEASDPRIKTCITEQRCGDWGHSLRDLGIRQARGQYIVHLNADNVLYPHAMQTLYAYSLLESRLLPLKAGPVFASEAVHVVNSDVLIFAIKMMGMINVLGSSVLARIPDQHLEYSLILPGWPPVSNRIDAMQLVAKKEIWLALGGWHDKREASDGYLLESIAKLHGYRVIPEILGEHW
jgi:hypothetical protein